MVGSPARAALCRRSRTAGSAALEWRAHQRQPAEHVGPHEYAPGRDPGAKIVPDHRRRLTVAERRDEPERVAHRVQMAERAQIVVVIGTPPGGATVPAQIGSDDVIPGGGQRPHDLAPGIGELGKTVQQQQAGTVGLAGF